MTDTKKLYEEIYELWDKGNFATALPLMEKVIKAEGETRGNLGGKFELLMQLGEPSPALDVALRIEEIADRASPYNALKVAEAYIGLGKLDEGLEWISTAVRERAFKTISVLEGDRYKMLADDPRLAEMREAAIANIGLGKPVPDFTVKLMDGSDYTLSEQKNKAILIDFWASWCPPCIKELPHVKEVYAEFKEKGFEIIGISLDDTAVIAEKFAEENEMPWPLTCSGDAWADSTVKLFKVNSIPSTWLIDEKGVLLKFDLRGDALKEAVCDLVCKDEDGKEMRCVGGVCSF